MAFCRYSLLAYLLEQEAQPQTIGSRFRQLEAESGALTYLTRLWRYFAALIKNCLDTLGQFCPPGPSFRAYLELPPILSRSSPLYRGAKLELVIGEFFVP